MSLPMQEPRASLQNHDVSLSLEGPAGTHVVSLEADCGQIVHISAHADHVSAGRIVPDVLPFTSTTHHREEMLKRILNMS